MIKSIPESELPSALPAALAAAGNAYAETRIDGSTPSPVGAIPRGISGGKNAT